MGEPSRLVADLDELLKAKRVLDRLATHLRENGGVSLHATREQYVVGSDWGQEAFDSPIASEAAYGMQPSLLAALDQMLTQAGVE